MRVLIADDETPARARLRRLLANEADMEIVAEVDHGEAALEAALDLRPDLLFLDVEMPALNGIAVMRQILQVWRPKFIFTTAHAEPAVDAIDLEATDYLLKPYTRVRFGAALARARRVDSRAPFAPSDNVTESAESDRFLIRSGNGYLVVRSRDIIAVQSAANYVILRTDSGKHILRRTLRQLESELCPRTFFRTSRSTIANLHEVREIKPTKTGTHTIVLSDGSDLPLTVGLRELENRLRTLPLKV